MISYLQERFTITANVPMPSPDKVAETRDELSLLVLNAVQSALMQRYGEHTVVGMRRHVS